MPADPRTADLAQVWTSPPTLLGWLGVVNHKNVGRRFLATGLVFFLLGGAMALLMRLQLARPELEIISPQLYNETGFLLLLVEDIATWVIDPCLL